VPYLGGGDGRREGGTPSDGTNAARGVTELQEFVEYQGLRRESGFLHGCEPWRDPQEGWQFNRAKGVVVVHKAGGR
jgi:hypothetical protein